MKITLFSLFMSVMWSSALILVIHFVRKKPLFIRKFGAKNLLLLYLFSIVRMMIPYEFSFARVLPAEGIFYDFRESVEVNKAGAVQPWLVTVLAAVWFMVSAVLILKFICQYTKAVRKILADDICEEEQCVRIFRQILNESENEMGIAVRRSGHVRIPMGIGIFQKTILLPQEDYDDSQLYYILRHEYTHFKNRDLLIKIFVHIFCCVYWWNPVVYLMKKDLAQILEIKCDIDVTDSMKDSDKVKYLTTIVSVLKNAGVRKREETFYGATALIAGSCEPETVERFKIVSDSRTSGDKNVFYTMSCFFGFILILFLSYSVAIHPGYKAPGISPVTEIESEVFEAGAEESFVDIMRNTKSAYAYLRGSR